jgi:fucose permease
MFLTVLGFEQSSVWGWSSPATLVCIIVGLLLMFVFVRFELSIKQPLLRLQIFLDRGFATDTLILGLMSIVFVPFFFFGSVYAQVALGKNSSQAGEYILWFFVGFVIAAQIGGRMLDRRGARPSIVIGGALGAVGFFLLAGKVTDLSLSAQSLYIALAGAGLGLMLGPASTDAVNRAPSTSYSEVTGITQTARNFGASLGLAVLGAILISRNETNVTKALTLHGVPRGVAHRVAASFSGSGAPSGSGSAHTTALVHSVQLAFAHSTQTVFYIMAGVMVATFIVAVRFLPRGRLELAEDEEEEFVTPAAVERGTAFR